MIKQNRLAQPVFLEISVSKVVIELDGDEPLCEQLLVSRGRSAEIAVDISRVGGVPQLLGRIGRRGLLRLHVGRLLRQDILRRHHADARHQKAQNQYNLFHTHFYLRLTIASICETRSTPSS